MATIKKQIGRFTETSIDDEVVVMRLDNGEFFSLSRTGAALWRLIDGTRDRASLLAALADQFGIDEASIAADVDDFLLRLTDTDLLASD